MGVGVVGVAGVLLGPETVLPVEYPRLKMAEDRLRLGFLEPSKHS